MAAFVGDTGQARFAAEFSARTIVLTTSSSLSIFGDLLIVIAFVFSPDARRLLTTRLVAFLAMADLLGQFPIVGSFSLPGPPISSWGPPWCAVQAAGNWYSAMASWLWTVAYAYAVSNGVSHPPFTSLRRRSCLEQLGECHFHLICWGLPALIVGPAFAAGLFGESDATGRLCTVKSSNVAMWLYGLLWFALAYNAIVYVHVHRLMHRALSANATVLDPQASLEMYRRLDALGGRFLLYLVTFLASQFPCALRHILVAILGDPKAWASPTVWGALNYLADGLCPLHGFLNGIVYGLSSKSIYAHWCSRCSKGDGSSEGTGCAPRCCCCYWRRRRTADDNSADERQASCTAPLVTSAAPSAAVEAEASVGRESSASDHV